MLDAHRYGVGGLLDRLVGLFGRANIYVELQRHLLRDEESDLVSLAGLARAFRVPVVATNDVRFAAAGDKRQTDMLLASDSTSAAKAAWAVLDRFVRQTHRPPKAVRDKRCRKRNAGRRCLAPHARSMPLR